MYGISRPDELVARAFLQSDSRMSPLLVFPHAFVGGAVDVGQDLDAAAAEFACSLFADSVEGFHVLDAGVAETVAVDMNVIAFFVFMRWLGFLGPV